MKQATGFLATLAMLAAFATPSFAQNQDAAARAAAVQAQRAEAAKKLEAAKPAAEAALKEMEANPDDAAKVAAAITAYQEVATLARTAVDRASFDAANTKAAEIANSAIDKHADNGVVVAAYLQGKATELAQVQGDVDTKVAAYDEFLAGLERFSSDDEAVKAAVMTAKRNVGSLKSRLTAERTREELIGQMAPAIPAEAWVNGEPVTAEDLKGKVVFLDFWAVWCGPCIATFPHLREWNEKYADQGLVMVGATRYYNYGWDDAAERSVRVVGISPEDEQAAMQKFAEHHDLSHRLAVVTDQEFWSNYGVTGIPQAVVIDREGKIRMLKVGSGAANAEAIDALLKELFNDTGSGDEQ